MDKPGAAAMQKPLVFISCGQYADHEKELGVAIAQLIKDESPYEAYLAQNQSTFEDLCSNVLSALDRAAAFVAVMHHRGDIQTPGGPVRRGSVWIEQELAIAAFIQRVLKRPIVVVLYLQRGVSVEGIRDKLMLNPSEFDTPDNVIDDLRRRLPSWDLVGEPVVDLQFASEDTRLGVGRRIELSTQRWTLPEGLPGREGLSALTRDRPSIRELALYHATRAETASVSFALTNRGESPLVNVRAEIHIPRTVGCNFMDDREIADEPTGAPYELATPAVKLDITVDVLRDVSRVEMSFGTIAPGKTVYVSGLHVDATQSMLIPIEIDVFAENLRRPVRFPLEMDIAVVPRNVSVEELLQLIGAED